jgi:hypothetical protein
MHAVENSYLRATCHPWPCLLFLLPLLLAYEGGVYWLGSQEAAAVRGGADTWMQWGFQSFGVRALYGPPILILVIFVIWGWFRRFDAPPDLVSVFLGMALECLFLALMLWGLGHIQAPFLRHFGVPMTQATGPVPCLALTISYVGAGIYEEVLFRLLLIPLLLWVMALSEMPRLMAIGMAVAISAVAFAVAHHVGPYGEPVVPPVFLFRVLAGVYFGLVYQFRGFGIAVGTHALYDILVGVAMS